MPYKIRALFGIECAVLASPPGYSHATGILSVPARHGMNSIPARVPSLAEKAVSAGVVVLLCGVLGGMLLAQAHFSPPVRVAGALALGAPRPAESIAPGLFATWPAGISPMGPAETFPAATLSDKIDGKAELYLSAGFVRLACQRARSGVGSDSWVEFFVYEMGTPSNAYSVWSSQKRPDASDAGVGDYSYRAENELCMVHGQFYVEVVGADSGELNRRAAESLAKAFVAGTPVKAHANLLSEQALFPVQGLVPGSIALVPSDVFGSDRLKAVFVAHYQDGAAAVTLFMARRGAPADAEREVAEFGTFLAQDCDGKIVAPGGKSVRPGLLSVFDLGGSFDAVFSEGPYLAGVHQAPSAASAQRWAETLRQRIRGGAP